MKLSSEQFSALDLLMTGVLIVDLRGLIVYANPALESLLGVSAPVLKGQHSKQFLESVGYWISLYQQNKSPAFLIAGEFTELHRPPNDFLQVYVSLHPFQNDEDYLMLEIHPAQKAMKLNYNRYMMDLSENNRRLLRNLAHEIKNPLGGIRGAAQLLQSELDNDDQKEYTAVVISEADRLQALVDKILAPYRQPYQPTKINIHEILERVRLLVEAEFPVGLTITRDYDISAPEINGDKGQLTQIFLNLMRNAVEAMSTQMADGTARLQLKTRVLHHVMIGSIRHKTALNVHVIDNGDGIPENIIDSIFYPLVSGKPQGSGLGLSLVQSFVDQHSGSIEVNSKKGRTDFSVVFPFEL